MSSTITVDIDKMKTMSSLELVDYASDILRRNLNLSETEILKFRCNLMRDMLADHMGDYLGRTVPIYPFYPQPIQSTSTFQWFKSLVPEQILRTNSVIHYYSRGKYISNKSHRKRLAMKNQKFRNNHTHNYNRNHKMKKYHHHNHF